MQKAYERIDWENYPSEETPVNEQNLNKMDVALDEVDNRVITLNTTKATKVEVSELFSNVAFDESTGIITFTRKNGSQITIDTKLEKLAINFAYDPVEEQLIITLDDGTKQYVDLSALITVYEFLDSDTIAFAIENGKVTAIVKEGSIEGKHLQPDYLADIMVQTEITTQKAGEAAGSAASAMLSQQASAVSEQASKEAENISIQKAGEAAESAEAALASERAALEYKQASALSQQEASVSEQASKEAENISIQKAGEAAESATKALESANVAAFSASYAVGGTGLREGENTDNSKYYYEQAKQISQGMNGLIPMGTIAFEDLPTSGIVKNSMYNISNNFTSDDRFIDGGGKAYGAGSNVYYTSSGKWDVLAASAVMGVKGAKEDSYRQGNVNITPDNIGALATDGDSKDNTVTFTSEDVADGDAISWTSVTALKSGISHATFFQRVSQMFKNVRYLYKMLGTTDISAIGDGTITGGLDAINSNCKLLYDSSTDIEVGTSITIPNATEYSHFIINYKCDGALYTAFIPLNKNFYLNQAVRYPTFFAANGAVFTFTNGIITCADISYIDMKGVASDYSYYTITSIIGLKL